MAANAATEKSHREQQERKRKFLEALRGTQGVPLSIRAACAEVGISRRTVRSWRDEDAAFDELYHDAMEDGTDTLEDVAVGRAVNGVIEPIFNKDGEQTGHKTKYSDDLMKFILAGRSPHRFRSGQVVNVAVNNETNISTDDQIARALALMLAQAQAKQLGS